MSDNETGLDPELMKILREIRDLLKQIKENTEPSGSMDATDHEE